MGTSRRMLTPLVLATMASQALLVVLAPTIVAIGADLGASVSAVGQARAVASVVSVVVSLALIRRIDAVGVGRLLRTGAAVAVVGSALVACSPTLPFFLGVHVIIGVAFAMLLSAGFAGVAAFDPSRRAWATGYVAAANAAAWIVVNPLAAALTDQLSWRAAQLVPAMVAAAAFTAARRVDGPRPVAVGLSDPGSSRAGSRALIAPLAEPSARRWIGSETLSFAGWTSMLTFSAAFLTEVAGVGQATAGWLLGLAAACYLVTSVQSGRLVRHVRRTRLMAASTLTMGALVVVMLALTRSPVTATVAFCLAAFAAGVRTPASASLGLAQLPGHPAVMMAARTAATQTGYLLGAVLGGAVIAVSGYPALGLVLAAVLTCSAALALGVRDPG